MDTKRLTTCSNGCAVEKIDNSRIKSCGPWGRGGYVMVYDKIARPYVVRKPTGDFLRTASGRPQRFKDSERARRVAERLSIDA